MDNLCTHIFLCRSVLHCLPFSMLISLISFSLCNCVFFFFPLYNHRKQIFQGCVSHNKNYLHPLLFRLGFCVCIINIFSFRLTKMESAVLTVERCVRHELYSNSVWFISRGSNPQPWLWIVYIGELFAQISCELSDAVCLYLLS